MLRRPEARLATSLLVAYIILVLALLGRQPLWLDELLQVSATRNSFGELFNGYLTHSAGQSPLGPIEQFLLIKLLGYSVWVSRLPAALMSFVACIGVVRLAKYSHVTPEWLALLIFATFPLQIRYATEARPYSQALCIGVWLSIFAITILTTRVELKRQQYIGYPLLLVIGLYSQPFVLFVSVWHAVYAIIKRDRRALTFFLISMAVAVLSYLPWYLYVSPYWAKEVNTVGLNFHWGIRLLTLVPRELVGAGYLGTAILVLAAIIAARSNQLQPGRVFWLLGLTVPIVLAVAADAFGDYFFAIRQTIVVLPALAILATPGSTKKTLSAIAVISILILVNIVYSVRWFAKPRENWSAAADILYHRAKAGACVIVLPEDSLSLYTFFQPGLHSHKCGGVEGKPPQTIELAVSPYLRDNGNQQAQVIRKLTASGCIVHGEIFDNPDIVEYVCATGHSGSRKF